MVVDKGKVTGTIYYPILSILMDKEEEVDSYIGGAGEAHSEAMKHPPDIMQQAIKRQHDAGRN